MILSDDPTTETETPVEEETNYYKTLAALLGAPIALALTREQVAAPFTPLTRGLLTEPLRRMSPEFLEGVSSVTQTSARALSEASNTPAEQLAGREVTGLMQALIHNQKTVPVGPPERAGISSDIYAAGLGSTPSGKIRTPVSQALTVSHELPHFADAIRTNEGGIPHAPKLKESLMDAIAYSIAPKELKQEYLKESFITKDGKTIGMNRFGDLFKNRSEPTFRKNMAILLKIMRRGKGP